MKTFLRKLDVKKLPDQSILNMTMDGFVVRYLMSDPNFNVDFLHFTYGQGNEQITVAQMSVRDFVEKIPTEKITKACVGIGKTRVEKMRKQFTRFGIEWK